MDDDHKDDLPEDDTPGELLPEIDPPRDDERPTGDGIAAAADNPGRGTSGELFDFEQSGLAGLSGLSGSMPSPGDPVSLPSAPDAAPDGSSLGSLASSVGPSMPTSPSDVPV